MGLAGLAGLAGLLLTGAAGGTVIAVDNGGPAAHAATQDEEDSPIGKADPVAMKVALDAFQARNQDKWIHTVDPATGRLKYLYTRGRSIFRGDPSKPEETARAFINANVELFMDKPDRTLVHRRTLDNSLLKQRLMRFEQEHKGLPVWGAGISITLDFDGHVRRVGSTMSPISESFDITPRISAQEALAIAAANHANFFAAASPPELVIIAGGEGTLVWRMFNNVGGLRNTWRHVVDARTGELLEQQSLRVNRSPRALSSAANASSPPPPDPCDHLWVESEPYPEGVVMESGPLFASITAGAPQPGQGSGNAGDSWLYDDRQVPAVYGAGTTLVPGIVYEITVHVRQSHFGWYDVYNDEDGYWDVAFMTVNSTGFFWDIAGTTPIANLQDCQVYLPDGESAAMIDLENPTMSGPLIAASSTFEMLRNHEQVSGQDWVRGDEIDVFPFEPGNVMGLCMPSDVNATLYYYEPDLSKTVYLSVGVDTGLTGNVDDLHPSQASFEVAINPLGADEWRNTLLFDPNPVVTHGSLLSDNNDSRTAIPEDGYVSRSPLFWDWEFWGFSIQDPDNLVSDFCRITDISDPVPGKEYCPNTSLSQIPEDHPASAVYLRDCPGFEALNAFTHISEYLIHTWIIGFWPTPTSWGICNYQIEVDPHYQDCDQSFYQHDGFGMGWIGFGGGGPNHIDHAEDGEVIVHEYAHACFDNINPNVFLTPSGYYGLNETGAINEGLADFMAASYFHDKTVAQGADPALMFDWVDVSLPAAEQRRMDRDLKYPQDMVQGGPNAYDENWHYNGQVVSRALWDIRAALGGDATDSYVFTTIMAANPPNPHTLSTFADFAYCMLQMAEADDVPVMIDAFEDRGIFRRVQVSAESQCQVLNGVVSVSSSTQDLEGTVSGTAPFELVYPFNETITLTADPSAVINGQTTPLSGWRIDGAFLPVTDPYAGTLTLGQWLIPPGGLEAVAVYELKIGDFNGDCLVDGADLAILLASWGQAGSPADLDGNGVVDGADLSILLGYWD